MYNNEFELEFEQGLGQDEYQESSFDGSSSRESYEFNQEFLGETNDEYESDGEMFEMGNQLSETQEMELAHELLSVQNEEELNMFLGKLIKGAGKAIGGIVRSPVFRGIGKALKTVAKTALPIAGGAVGSFFGGPLGGMVGGKLGSMASNLFELELEGLSPEDQEFEMARAYVRFANSAVHNAANLQQRQPGTEPAAAVRSALTQAARQHAPGLLRPRNANGTFRSTKGPGPGSANGQQGQNSYPQRGGAGRQASRGTWTRQGRTLVIQL